MRWQLLLSGVHPMSPPKPVEYRDASPEVRAVFDDIKQARKVDDVNNFWKYLARDPATLKRTWESVKQIMAHPISAIAEIGNYRCASRL
jgi:hypothetical protein